MDNTVPLRCKDLTPEMVMRYLFDEGMEKFRSIYIVAIDKDGQPQLHCTGDLRDMSFASAYLQHITMRYFRGEVEDAR